MSGEHPRRRTGARVPVRPGGNRRGRGGKSFSDFLQHRRQLSQHLVIPETQHTKSLSFQPRPSYPVGLASLVLSAIHLDHQAGTETHKTYGKTNAAQRSRASLSTMYGPMGCWRLNFHCASRCARNCVQRRRSASVRRRRKALASGVPRSDMAHPSLGIFTPLPSPLPQGERGSPACVRASWAPAQPL